MCCFQLLLFADKIKDMDRTKNMNVFMKESQQILSKLRDNLRRGKETLDRLALDSEKEELLRDKEARQVEEIEALLDSDVRKYIDRAKLTQNGNSDELLSSNNLMVSLKSNKRGLNDILTLLLPSNLKSSEALSDRSDPQSNFFGIGGIFTSSTTQSPATTDFVPSLMQRTIMRAPPPIPKHVGISRIRTNGSIVCFSVLNICTTPIHIHTTMSDSGTSMSSAASVTSQTQNVRTKSTTSSPQPGSSSPLPYEVFLNNQDIELDESSEGHIKKPISLLQWDTGNLFQNSEYAATDVSPSDFLDNAYSKLPLDMIINTLFSKEINKSNLNNTFYKLFFGAKGYSTESTSTPTLLSSTQRKKKDMLSTLFGKIVLSGGATTSHANKRTASTMKNANNTIISSTQSINNAPKGSTLQIENHVKSDSPLIINLSTGKVVSGTTMENGSSDGNSTTPPFSSTEEPLKTLFSIEPNTANSEKTTCLIVTTTQESDDSTTVCTETTETCPEVSSQTEGTTKKEMLPEVSSTTQITTSASTSTSTSTSITTSTDKPTDVSTTTTKPSETTSVTAKPSETTSITAKPDDTTTATPSSTSTINTSTITKKTNFFLRMLYYQPNTQQKHSTSTPSHQGIHGSNMPFQLVILDPQIFKLPNLNGTVIAITRKP